MFADGRIYFLSEEGVATVIAPGKAFRQAGDRFARRRDARVDRGRGGSFFIRSDTHLYRIANAA